MRLPDASLRHLSATTRFGDVRLLDEVDSTNRVVRDAAGAGAPEGLVVVADRQTAGRGRLGRSWDAPAGTALLVSVLLRPIGLDPDRSHLVTAAVGLAAADACREVGGAEPELKWPNDLLVANRKLAGILAERVGDAVVVGLGCNVSAAPDGAACVDDGAGRPVDRGALLVAVLEGLERRLGRWDEVATEHARRCATVGRRVRVEGLAGGDLHGLAVSIDGAGRLVVDPDGGRRIAVSAADVVHLRS